MKYIGIVLIVLGVLGLVWGGITYVKDRDSIDLGPIEVATEKKKTIPIPPVASVVALAAGIGLIALDGRRRPA